MKRSKEEKGEEMSVNQKNNRKGHRNGWVLLVLFMILIGIGWFSRERLMSILLPVRLDTPMVVWDETEDM